MDIYFILVLLFLPSVLGTEKLFTFDSDMLRYVPECNTADFLNCRKVSKLGLKIESNKAIFLQSEVKVKGQPRFENFDGVIPPNCGKIIPQLLNFFLLQIF